MPHTNLELVHSNAIFVEYKNFKYRYCRKVRLSIADGKDPAAEDVLLLVNAALKTPFAKAAQAVIEAEPRYVRTRLIELAAMVAAGNEAEAVEVKATCDNAYQETGGKLRCHFVDLIPVMDDASGKPNLANFASTDIHPNTTGSALMAKAVWAKMKDDCMAQPVSSGCCAP